MKNNNIKVVEIRDRATCIPAFAIRILPSDEKQLFLFKHCGYRSWTDPCILLISIEAPWYARRCSDEWNNESPRTMITAHEYIEKNFDKLESCEVIDVEFILKEKDKPCESIMRELLNEHLEGIKKLSEDEDEG